MKVLLINNYHYIKGGSETVYFNTAEILERYGHEVVCFSFDRPQNLPCKQSDYFVNHGNKWTQLKSYFYNTRVIDKLEKLINEEHPDIAHVHLFWGGLSPSIFSILKKHKIPLIHTAHDYRMICPAYTFKDGTGNICERCGKWNYYQCTIHKCSKSNFFLSLIMTFEMYFRQLFFNPITNISGFIFVSRFSQQVHLKHCLNFEKVPSLVLYNYTTPRYERVKGIKDYYLFYGRLSFEKGIFTLLDVFEKLPNLRIKVVGTGPLEQQLKSKYSKKNIEFFGYKTGKELYDLVRNARFVCVPSEWYENNPMTIIESYSYGIPVIGARIGGITEIIDDKNTGFLFPAGNKEELEKVITCSSLLNETDYNCLSENAYSFFARNFSPENYYEQLIAFYKIILNKYRD